MKLRKLFDTFGGIPLFIILSMYFYMNRKGYIEYFLLFSCILALFIDIYLSFYYDESFS